MGFLVVIITIGLIECEDKNKVKVDPCPKCYPYKEIDENVIGDDGIVYFNCCYLFCWAEMDTKWFATNSKDPAICDAWIEKYGEY